MMKKLFLLLHVFFFIFFVSNTQAAFLFTKTLSRGKTSSDIRELQQILGVFSDIYPERMITGFFGIKTEQAVRRFQKKYGIEQTGTVGPKTRAKLNEISLSFSSSYAPVIETNSIKSFPSTSPMMMQQYTPQYSPALSVSPNALSRSLSAGKCDGNGSVTLTSPPIHIKDIAYILPMGLMSGSHVTPVDHLYLHTSHQVAGRYDVLAPADGYVVSVDKVGDSQDYRMVLEHTCTFYTIYIHVTELAPKIAIAVGTSLQKPKTVRIFVRAGEVIGTKVPDLVKKTFQVDFSVANANLMLKGFVVPEHYVGEIWKIHTDDPYAYYKNPLQTELIAKSVRTVQPIAGKIDYDIDGRMVGNWFREGTNGYNGSNPYQYWEGHLTIAYDYLDSTNIRISIGNWEGRSMQAAVKNNKPDPKDVSVQTGLVKYELIDAHYTRSNGESWDQETLEKNVQLDISQGSTYGTLLVQLLDDRKLKLETFPGRSSSAVNGFTTNAVVYER